MDEFTSQSDALSVETLDLLGYLLTQSDPTATSAEGAPDVEQLVHYVAGTLSAAAYGQLEARLLYQPWSRALLRRTRAVLLELQGMSWQMVSLRARNRLPNDELTAEVAQAWMILVAGHVVAAPRSPARWRQEGWAQLRQKVRVGVDEAQAAWAAFLSFGEQWKAAMRLFALAPALQRGGTGQIDDSSSRNAGIAITGVECHINSEGELRVVAFVAPVMQGRASADLQETLLLSLRRDEDIWPLAVGTRAEDRVEWSLPGFGTALQLPPGPLPPQYFAFDSTERPAAPARDLRSILAGVFDADGQLISGALAYIELIGALRWENEQFVAEVAIPAFIRLAYPTHRLELSLYISEAARQRLGLWPVREWDDRPRLLTAECPGIPDTILPDAAILQARLIDPD